MRLCAACHKQIGIKELIECTTCIGKYHHTCVNISVNQFKSQRQDLERLWVCPECEMSTKRRGPKSDSTPVRNRNLGLNEPEISVSEKEHDDKNTGCHTPSTDDASTQPNAQQIPHNEDSESSEALNTQNPIDDATKHNTTNRDNNAAILQSFSKLLEQNNIKILSGIRDTIHTEIGKAINKIKEEFSNSIGELTGNQKNLQNQIKKIDERLKTLENQNTKLKQEIDELKNLEHQAQTQHNRTLCCSENSKKIVLHGLPEHYYETEQELHHQVIQIFRDILNVDLLGYIEETKRIGKFRRSQNPRPLEIELISKRMCKYVLDNTGYFKNTPLAISEFLDANELQERKLLREKLKIARQNGSHAIIRDNKLVIDGQIVSPTQEPKKKSYSQTVKEKDRLLMGLFIL